MESPSQPAVRIQSAVAALAFLLAPAAPAAPPLEEFFASQQLTRLTLSPDGSRLAGIVEQPEQLVVLVVDVETGAILGSVGLETARLRGLWWASDERLLVSVPHERGLSTRTRLVAFNYDGSQYRDFARRQRTVARSQFQDDIIHFLPDDPRHVLIAYVDYESSTSHALHTEVYKLDVYNGKLLQVGTSSARPFHSWWAGPSGTVRMGEGQVDDRETYAIYRRDGDSPWMEIDPRRLSSSGLGEGVLGLGPGPNQIYVAVRRKDEDCRAVYLYDVESGELGEPLLAIPGIDVPDGVLRDLDGRVVGMRYTRDYPETHWLDPRWRAIAERVDAALPDRNNRIVDASRDAGRVLVVSESDRHPPEHILFTAEDGRMQRVVRHHPALDPETLVARRRFRYPARDGTELWGYLAVPGGSEPRGLPVVVMPHGGPWARDSLGFDPEIQFLASRGWAVFQPNFRGSVGFGWRHLSQGFQQWGLLMQDDITDGVRHLIETGIADADRICIYGWSYGGYAAAAGLAGTPELYRCGVTAAGVSDLPGLLEERAWFLYHEMSENLIGDRKAHTEKLEAASPLRNAARIRAPIMIAHGVEDRVVRVRHSRELRDALERAGKSYEYLELPGEIHGLSIERNRLEFYRRLEAFLRSHLDREPEVAAPPAD